MSRSNFFWGLLTSQSSAADTCRVCKRAIAKGDYVKRHTEHAGVACVTCGFWTLGEMKSNAAFVAAVGGDRNLTNDEVYWLVDLGIIKAERATKKISWTTCGKRLRDEFCASKPAVDASEQTPPSARLPASAADLGARQGGSR